MAKTFSIPFLLFFISCSYGQHILKQDYSFLVSDGEITKLHQSNDTLYELQCSIYFPCQPKPEKHYKIINSYSEGDFTILKLEQLDTISLTTNPYPTTRYSVLALRGLNSKQLGYLPLNVGLTKYQIDTTKTNIDLLHNKFFFTFFSESYLKEFSLLKKIDTKEEVEEIVEFFKGEKVKKLIDKYKQTETRDMYASGLFAEILNMACIEKGYNPIGAGKVLKRFMKN